MKGHQLNFLLSCDIVLYEFFQLLLVVIRIYTIVYLQDLFYPPSRNHQFVKTLGIGLTRELSQSVRRWWGVQWQVSTLQRSVSRNLGQECKWELKEVSSLAVRWFTDSLKSFYKSCETDKIFIRFLYYNYLKFLFWTAFTSKVKLLLYILF